MDQKRAQNITVESDMKTTPTADTPTAARRRDLFAAAALTGILSRGSIGQADLDSAILEAIIFAKRLDKKLTAIEAEEE